ncbi:MAG: PQQ-binding-like beta-propeller repeat protein [Bacteroidota bacterium]
MRKILVLALCGISMGMPASAQFSKLKGLVDKDKKEKTSNKEESKGESQTKASAGDDVSASSSENVKINPKAWSLEFDGNIDWFRLSPTGKVIASTNSALYGVEPSTGKVAWKHDFLKNLTTENYNPISNSPFIAIVTGSMFNMQQVVLDVNSGKIIANTKDMGMKMVNKRFTVPSLGGIIFTGYLNNAPSIVFVDAKTGEKKWVLSKIFESASEMLVARPLAADDNTLLMATGKRLYKIDVKAGTVSWAVDFKTNTDKGTLATEASEEANDKGSTKGDEKKGGLMAAAGLGGGGMKDGIAQLADAVYGKFLLIDNQPGIVYYYNSQEMSAFDIATGKPVWSTVKFSDPIGGLLFDERGFLVSTNDKKAELLLLDYKTGKQRWSPVELKGRITALKLNGTSLALASAKESGNNYVNIIDINTGVSAAKSEMKVAGQIRDIRQTGQGLIYRTNKELNIQDIQTGKDVWPKSVSYKIGGGIGADKGTKTYFWADNELHVIDNSNGQYKVLGKGLKLGGDEEVDAVEIREKGILISSSQNVALFDWDGNKVFHVYQKAPGTSLANKIMNVAVIAMSVSNSAASGYQAGLSGPNTTSYNQNMANADRWSDLGSSALADMKRRFTASQDAQNYKVILTDIDGPDGGYGLVRVNKDSGALEAKVVLKDKKPDYISDDTDNLIFYKDNAKTITGFKL